MISQKPYNQYNFSWQTHS